MKKFLIGLISLIVLAYVGLQIADKVVKSGDDYYVQITTDGKRLTRKTIAAMTSSIINMNCLAMTRKARKRTWISTPTKIVHCDARPFLK